MLEQEINLVQIPQPLKATLNSPLPGQESQSNAWGIPWEKGGGDVEALI